MRKYKLINSFLVNPEKYDINRYYEKAYHSEIRAKRLSQKKGEAIEGQYKLF